MKNIENDSLLIENNNHQSRLFPFVKWAVLVVAYFVVIYKLATFDDYDLLFACIRNITYSQCVGLIVILLLFPVNYLLEALKWKVSISGIANISLRSAIISTFVGNVGAIITPNRLGDYPVRATYLGLKNKVEAVMLGMIGSAMLSLVIVVFGVFALIHYISAFGIQIVNKYYFYLLFLIISSAFVLILLLPFVMSKIHFEKIRNKYLYNFFSEMSKMNYSMLLKITLLSLLRYVVFFSQYAIILSFFSSQITIVNALLVIPIVYLFTTITPTISASEAATRAGYALLLFEPMGVAAPAVIIATLFLWIVNNGIPICVGFILSHFKVIK